MKKLLMILLFLASASVFAQEIMVSGTITDENGNPLPGATLQVKGTTRGTLTDSDGRYSINVSSASDILLFSFVGYKVLEVPVQGRTTINVSMELELQAIEVTVVGYGTQKKSDITGTVASLPQERLEMVPNLSIAQAIQGYVPGVMVSTNAGGTNPDQTIMIRGRNSILADNEPLIVVDGIPYSGNISDINPNDVKGIEILKDASAAAIYGSRGANGVILVTTKEGEAGKISVQYEGKYSIQQITKKADYLTGPEYYDYKITRQGTQTLITESEIALHEAGEWSDWFELASRQGQKQEHNLSISGGSEKTTFYIGGGLTDIAGVAINDDYRRISTRINIDTKITDWLTIGTRTQMAFVDESGQSPDFEDCIEKNPLTTAYDENGKLTLWPWPEHTVVSNPLQGLYYTNKDLSYQAVTNNFALITFPWVRGLTYRLNTGFRVRTTDDGTYRPVTTESGLPSGKASLSTSLSRNTVVENIVSYTREFGKHTIFATGVYSFEGDKYTGNDLDAEVFPNDFLGWYSVSSAEVSIPTTSFEESYLLSQMGRLNYSYASRYLLTVTVRRDGFSGFGKDNKWGVFPSVALGWNLANEGFFPLKDLFSVLKLRASVGLNGNQAIDAYQSLSRLVPANIMSGPDAQIGYKPAELGNADLGWESSRTVNIGMDFALLKNRISGNIDYYLTNTFDLLLNRTISSIHGVTPVTHLNTTGLDYPDEWVQPAITQNIGETQNQGVELYIDSRNIIRGKFVWSTSGNFSFNKNKIVSLYGLLDEEGNEVDDLANNWFIGYPIRINFDYVWDGVWQLDEVGSAPATRKAVAGMLKLKDGNGDGVIDEKDREIIGQLDPKIMAGLNNTFSYGNFKLNVFIHGAYGATIRDYLMDENDAEIRYNTTKKNYWTPKNPTNDWPMNKLRAELDNGHEGHIYADPSFIRIKDITLSYDLPQSIIRKIGLDRIRLYVNFRNMFTFTKWPGLDPELIVEADDPTSDNIQLRIPMVKEYVFGLSVEF